MTKKRHRSSKSAAPLWPSVLAGIAILIGIIWNDRKNERETSKREIGPSCQVVMAESALPANDDADAGWGVFTLKDIDEDQPVSYGDLVVHMPDPLVQFKADLELLLQESVWDEFTTGGPFEGSAVHSIVPGVGSLANGHVPLSNVIIHLPTEDNGGLTRQSWPGAGAITHYHDLVYKTKSRKIHAGDEIVVDYGGDEVTPYGGKLIIPRRKLTELRRTGICLDNIQPNPSTNPQAGRGAFATRPLVEGSVIAPAPLIVIGSRDALTTHRNVTDGDTQHKLTSQQLLLNYCFGHANSSLLFFPFAPVVNLINHDTEKANAKLKWSESSLHYGREWLEWPLDKVKALKRPGLLLEFVATRDIQEGEEIFIDYGSDWQEAWNRHKAHWEPIEGAEDYVYPFEILKNESANGLLTAADKERYPSNIQTACFYHYGDHYAMEGNKTPIEWFLTPRTRKMSSLRPCRLLNKTDDGKFYSAKMANLLTASAQPRHDHIYNLPHVVVNIPREAILLKDRKYTSDQHLRNAFRHEIAISDEIFPTQWMDRRE